MFADERIVHSLEQTSLVAAWDEVKAKPVDEHVIHALDQSPLVAAWQEMRARIVDERVTHALEQNPLAIRTWGAHTVILSK